MRKIFLLIAALLVSSALYAQVRIGLNINIDQQPVWGPTGHSYVEYYYFPAIQVYYNVPQHKFYYYSSQRGRWISRSQLPYRYRNYDLYRAYKVVVNEPRPYRDHRRYRDRYSSYRDRRNQETIRDSRDSRYFVNKDHPEHDNWIMQYEHGPGFRRGSVGDNRYDPDRQGGQDNDDRGRDDGNRFNENNGRDNDGNRDNSMQGNWSAGVNISDQPIWGPVGYDRAEYYYIPDINSYYSVSERQYIYWDGSEWRHAWTLPSSYNGYDPYNSYKVVFNEDAPYKNNDSHRNRYRSLKGNKDQLTIRDSRDSKYFVNKDHPEHDNWVRDQLR